MEWHLRKNSQTFGLSLSKHRHRPCKLALPSNSVNKSFTFLNREKGLVRIHALFADDDSSAEQVTSMMQDDSTERDVVPDSDESL